MYNFTKYLEWPPEKREGDFIIGVYGSSPIKEELEIIAAKKKVGNQNIVVKQIEGKEQACSCHIVFIPSKYSGKTSEIATLAKDKGVVIITDEDGLAAISSGINYVLKDGKQQFEVNKKHIEDHGVAVNSTLLTLGIPVE